ncbi:MAG: RidA family protein [Chloroflexi bacterium]|nr:RidA family protein [Chloroflexota bacterium]
MQRNVVILPTTPGATDLPYSSAVIASGHFVFTSGYVGFDPATGDMPAGIEAQTAQALENLKAVLEAAGSALEHVVKTTVYLTRAEDYAGMNAVYKRYFPTERPARATLVVQLVRPDLLIEIEMVALMPDGGGT